MKVLRFLFVAILFCGCLTDEQQAEMGMADSPVVQETEIDTFVVGGKKSVVDLQTPEGESLRLANDTAIQDIRQALTGNTNDQRSEALENTIVRNPDVGPSFPGGSAAMDKFIARNLAYPLVAAQNDIEGTVNVRFVVETDGRLTGIVVQKGLGYGCDEAAVDLIKSMPAWTPGKKGGANVRCSVVLPLAFHMPDQN